MEQPFDTLNAIHRAILEEPAVDAHRLVYADALEDLPEPQRYHHEPLARFIRAQVVGGKENRRLANSLLTIYYQRWLPPGLLPSHPASLRVNGSELTVQSSVTNRTRTTLTFARGFVDVASTTLAHLSWIPLLVAHHPLRLVKLRGVVSDISDGVVVLLSFLPDGVVRRLTGHEVRVPANWYVRRYGSKKLAERDLSRAILEWAREHR